MKIIAIRLKNLTSIEGSVEIDFTVEPLSSAGIFAISGATGAGKSTLSDFFGQPIKKSLMFFRAVVNKKCLS